MSTRINTAKYASDRWACRRRSTINQSDCDLPLPLGSNGARFAGKMAISPRRGRKRFSESIIYDRISANFGTTAVSGATLVAWLPMKLQIHPSRTVVFPNTRVYCEWVVLWSAGSDLTPTKPFSGQIFREV